MMTATGQAQTTGRLLFGASPAVSTQSFERSPWRLTVQTRLQMGRILRGWSRDVTTALEALVVPMALLFTLNLVLGKGISQVSGHSALYGSVPMVAMVGAMSGATVSGLALMRERTGLPISARSCRIAGVALCTRCLRTRLLHIHQYDRALCHQSDCR